MPAWRELELFRGLPPDALDALAASLQALRFAPGEVILRQGDPGEDMYVLAAGQVRVRVEQPDRPPRELLVSAPDVFGEIALVTNEPRSATVIAETDAVVERLTRAQLQALVARSPAAAAFVTESVGRRLLRTDTIRAVGKYQVLGQLGSGSAATVFEALHPGLERPVALKMLRHSLAMKPGFAEQFQREARLVAGLRHEGVVQVLDTEEAWGTRFIVMERLEGRLLEELLAAEGPLPAPLLRRILREVLAALQHAHDRGLLHRDVKPANAFATADGRVKLLDFGIAVETARPGAGPAPRLGTPYYMSPEQILQRPLDGRSDLYSVGIMAYELATGQVPFDAADLRGLLQAHLRAPLPDPAAARPDLPADLRAFIRKATAKHPDDRYPSCEAAARALRAADERPQVERCDLLTVAISAHPSRRPEVGRALDALEAALAGLSGVRIARGGLPAAGGD